MYAVHVKAPYLLTQKALPFLNDNGRIVNLSSGLTRFTTLGRSAYATVNAVAPGIVETKLSKATFENEKALGFIRSNTAMNRTAALKDIGGVVAFLCSGEAR